MTVVGVYFAEIIKLILSMTMLENKKDLKERLDAIKRLN